MDEINECELQICRITRQSRACLVTLLFGKTNSGDSRIKKFFFQIQLDLFVKQMKIDDSQWTALSNRMRRSSDCLIWPLFVGLFAIHFRKWTDPVWLGSASGKQCVAWYLGRCGQTGQAIFFEVERDFPSRLPLYVARILDSDAKYAVSTQVRSIPQVRQTQVGQGLAFSIFGLLLSFR